jgi:para-nitrobenzyl esterase
MPVHASEVKYVFDNLGDLPLFPDSSNAELVAASAPDQRLADQMASYWVNFARSGNPNGSGLPEWPAHTGLNRVEALILDSDPASESLPTLEQMEAQEMILKNALEALD